MPVAFELRQLDIDIPSQPDALVRLSLLMAEDEVDLRAVAALIEADMALAAAVMKAVNSSLYGLRGRVQSVQQAITYLGTHSVAAITFEIGLRAAFSGAAELEPLWQRAALRSRAMGQLAAALGLDAWGAHSAGLFEECGKAVLYRHAPEHYRPMLNASDGDLALCELEHAGFGVSHDALGAALCESWGLGPAAVASVRHHVQARASAQWPDTLPTGRRGVLGLSVLASALLAQDPADDDALHALADHLAPAMDLAPEAVLRAARHWQKLQADAAEHGR
jgi:HD-like signal output (HDOD) protein